MACSGEAGGWAGADGFGEAGGGWAAVARGGRGRGWGRGRQYGGTGGGLRAEPERLGPAAVARLAKTVQAGTRIQIMVMGDVGLDSLGGASCFTHRPPPPNHYRPRPAPASPRGLRVPLYLLFVPCAHHFSPLRVPICVHCASQCACTTSPRCNASPPNGIPVV
jgi:hypothetical protein